MLTLMHVVVLASAGIAQVSLPVAPVDNRNPSHVVVVNLGKQLIQADITVGAGVYGPFKGTK